MADPGKILYDLHQSSRAAVGASPMLAWDELSDATKQMWHDTATAFVEWVRSYND